MAEMLIQSADNGNIDLLPALPGQWNNGNVKGLCARGGFTVDMQWNDGKVNSYTLTARTSGKARVKANGKTRTHKLAEGESITVEL